MALCLFKCFSACGCRDYIISKFAFYPQNPGYRFQEIEFVQSKSSTQTKNNMENRQVKDKIEEFAFHQNIPRFYHLPSDDQKHYELILVYEEHEVLLNDQNSLNAFNKQQQNDNEGSQRNEADQSKTGLSLVNQQKEFIQGKNYQLEIKEVFGESEQKHKHSSAAVKAAIKTAQHEESKEESKSNSKSDKAKQQEKIKNKIGKKEESFHQVEDLHLICFKKKNRENNLLCGYHIENLKHRSEIIVIYSHGNSTDIGYMINQALDVSYNLRVNVIAYDYSGYGKSQGKPSEKSFIYDLEAIYKYALQIGYKSINIVFYGQSVGSGPSTFLASQKKFPIGGLIIHSGFTSGLRITQQQEEKLSKTYSKDFFPNVEFIKKVNAPIFIIHGTNDQDIKIHHASELYQRAKKNYTPFFLEVKGAGHNDIEHEDKFRKDYFRELRKFMAHLRQNRNSIIQDYIQKQNLFKQKRDSGNNGEQKDIQGFAGDGQSESFNHIYYQYFTPPNSSVEQPAKRPSIDKNMQYQNSSSQNQITVSNSSYSKKKTLSSKSNKQNQEYITEKNTYSKEGNSQNINIPIQKSRDSTTFFEVETKIDRTEQHPPSGTTGREDGLSEYSSQQQKEIIQQNIHNEQINEKLEKEGQDLQIEQKIANAFAQESDDENFEDILENKKDINNNQQNYLKGDKQENINQQENVEQVQEFQCDSLKEERLEINLKNKSHSLTDQNNRNLFCSYRSQKQLNHSQNQIENSMRMSSPNIRGQQKTLGSASKKRYVEDEKIRLHNVTSIIRKKQNSQFSAYILDHSSYSNHDNNSESLNSSLIKQCDKSQPSKNSLNKELSPNSSKRDAQNNLKASPQQTSYVQNIDLSNSKKQDQQKYNSYQVDSVKEEVQEYQMMSSSLKEGLVSPSKKLQKDEQYKFDNATLSIQNSQQNNKSLTKQHHLIQQIFNQEKIEDLDCNPHTLENSSNQFQDVHYISEGESNGMSDSDSPHNSKSIKQVKSDLISIVDLDHLKRKKEDSIIRSKDTLKSINSNY